MLKKEEKVVAEQLDQLIKTNFLDKEINIKTIKKLILQSSELVLNAIPYERYEIDNNYEILPYSFDKYIKNKYLNNIHNCYKLEIGNIIPNIIIKSLKNVKFNINGFDVVYRIFYYTLNDNVLTKLYKKSLLNYVYGMIRKKDFLYLDQSPDFINIFINDMWKDIYSKYDDIIYIDTDFVLFKSEETLNDIIKHIQFDSIEVNEIKVFIVAMKKYMIIDDNNKIIETKGIKICK